MAISDFEVNKWQGSDLGLYNRHSQFGQVL